MPLTTRRLARAAPIARADSRRCPGPGPGACGRRPHREPGLCPPALGRASVPRCGDPVRDRIPARPAQPDRGAAAPAIARVRLHDAPGRPVREPAPAGHPDGVRRHPQQCRRDHRERRIHGGLGAQPRGCRVRRGRNVLAVARDRAGAARRDLPLALRVPRRHHSDPHPDPSERRFDRRHLPVGRAGVLPVRDGGPRSGGGAEGVRDCRCAGAFRGAPGTCPRRDARRNARARGRDAADIGTAVAAAAAQAPSAGDLIAAAHLDLAFDLPPETGVTPALADAAALQRPVVLGGSAAGLNVPDGSSVPLPARPRRSASSAEPFCRRSSSAPDATRTSASPSTAPSARCGRAS